MATYFFAFPPEPTSETHAYHTGVTQFTPTIEIGENYNSFFGYAPNQVHHLMTQQIALLPAAERAAWVQQQTGIQPTIQP